MKGEIVSISNSSDPYPRMEEATGVTRRCLEILAANDCRIQIVSKSNLVTRDVDVLSRVPSTVALTITTDDDNLAKVLEPNAPPPSDRMRALEEIAVNGIPVSVRIDPIIPFVNDAPNNLISELAAIGVKHVTSSTYKAKPNNWRRLSAVLPDLAQRLRPLYFVQGERIGGSILLPKEFRFKLMKGVRDMATVNGMKFGCCREGLPYLNTASCDGSWLLKKKEI